MAKKSAKKKSPVCSDFGGKRKDGKPCSVQVGDSKCRHHTDDANERRKQLKRRVVKLLEQGTYNLVAVCSENGIAPVTLWRWRDEDPVFRELFADAQVKSDGIRVQLIEDSLLQQILAGTASAAVTILFLTNRAPDRWKHRYTLEHSGPGGGPIDVRKIDIGQLTTEELKQLKEMAKKVASDEPGKG